MRYRTLCESDLSEIDKAMVVIYAEAKDDGISAKEIAEALEGSGHAKINTSRLEKRLRSDRRVNSAANGFRVAAKHGSAIATLAKPFSGPIRPSLPSGQLDPEIFVNAHSYVKNVVEQINISYDNACYDCAAVMIRRLFETLIVDSFEKQGCLSEITKPDGNLHQLSILISRLKSTSSFSVSRQTKDAAEHLKDVGDWSAHNRRHRARKSDIDVALRHMRLASSDLLHLAGQE